MWALNGSPRGSANLWSSHHLPLVLALVVSILSVLSGIQGVSGYGVGHRNLADEEDIMREMVRRNEAIEYGGPPSGAREEAVGYGYEPVAEDLVGEEDTERDQKENTDFHKRERCYCDLDLFCKRFGCRKRKRTSLMRLRAEKRQLLAEKRADDVLKRLRAGSRLQERSLAGGEVASYHIDYRAPAVRGLDIDTNVVGNQ